MMKLAITAATLAAAGLASPVKAQGVLEDLLTGYCGLLGVSAGIVMQDRQTDLTMSEARQRVSKKTTSNSSKRIDMALINMAYEVPSFSGKSLQEKEISTFRNRAERICFGMSDPAAKVDFYSNAERQLFDALSADMSWLPLGEEEGENLCESYEQVAELVMSYHQAGATGEEITSLTENDINLNAAQRADVSVLADAVKGAKIQETAEMKQAIASKFGDIARDYCQETILGQ